MVAVDADLEETVAELLKERGAEAEARIPRAESQISVREMQQRLRAGQSIKQVARAAGVHDDWVQRFAVPIQAEQQQVVRQTLELTFTKARNGKSSQNLGMSVWWNLLDRSVTLPEDGWDTGWSAFLVRGAVWVVRFEYDARKRHFTAEWEVDLKAGTVNSRNRLGTELAYIEPGRRRRVGPPPPIAGGLLTRPAPPMESPPTPAPAPAVDEEEAAPPKKRKAPAKKAKQRPAIRKAVPAKKVSGARKKKAAVKPAPAPARARRR